jgi:hypothetical protein
LSVALERPTEPSPRRLAPIRGVFFVIAAIAGLAFGSHVLGTHSAA